MRRDRKDCVIAVLVAVVPAPVAFWLSHRGVRAEGALGFGVYAFYLLAVPLATRWRGRSLREIGLAREGLVASLGYSLLLPAAVLVIASFRSDLALAEDLGPGRLAAWAAYCLLLSGPAQEILFRGLVLSAFRRWRGPAAGLIVSALLYGMAHVRMGPAGMAANAAYGLFYGAVVLRTQNVWGPVAAHGVFNFVFGYVLSTGVAVL